MRILIDARLYGLEHAGLGRYIINLISELKKQDKDNTYILLLREKYYRGLKVPENWEKVEVAFRHYSLREQLTLHKIIQKKNPDLVHFPHFNVPFFYRGKFVVTIHDILMHNIKGKNATTLPKYKYFFKRAGYKTVFNNAVKRSVKVIVPSESAKKDLVSYYKINSEKVEVTYEGLDPNVVQKGNSREVLDKYKIKNPYFFYVGNAYPHKNLKRAIEATVVLNRNKKNKINFLIATPKNNFVSRLQKEINTQEASRFVRILGFVPDIDIGTLERHSIAFLYPSLIEGFGLQGLEAIANGTVVLVSDIPVFKEVYKDNVFYFNPFDFSSIEKAMRNVISLEKSRRSEKIIKSQEYIKRYSWQKMTKETIEVYEEALKNSF